jgi:hypothetical protein
MTEQEKPREPEQNKEQAEKPVDQNAQEEAATERKETGGYQ